MKEPDKSRQSSQKRKIRATQVVKGTIEGKTGEQIAEELGVTRQTVSEILNSEDAKKLTTDIIEEVRDQIARMAPDAAKVVNEFIKNPKLYGGDSLQASFKVLKTIGAISEKQEMIHKFPQPTVIRRGDREIILGVKVKNGEDDDDHE